MFSLLFLRARRGSPWFNASTSPRLPRLRGATLPARAERPGLGVGGVEDVADAGEVGGAHDPQAVVAHVADDGLEAVGELELRHRAEALLRGAQALAQAAAELVERDR